MYDTIPKIMLTWHIQSMKMKHYCVKNQQCFAKPLQVLVIHAATALLAVLCILCIHTLDRVTRRMWHYKHLHNCSGQRMTVPSQQILENFKLRSIVERIL